MIQVTSECQQNPDLEPDGDRDLVLADAGMATAEYAVATLAACAFAGLLLVVVRSDQVRELLLGIITRALGAG